MSFTLAAAGNAQNASFQTQYANALNAATAATIQLYNTSAPALLIYTPGASTSQSLTLAISGDGSPRGTFSTYATTQGRLSANVASSAATQANIYNSNGSTTLNMDYPLSCSNDLSVTGSSTLSALTVTGAPAVTGTVSVPNNPINGIASYLGNGSTFNTANGNAEFTNGENSTSESWISNYVNGQARGFKFDTVSGTGTVTTNARTESNGRITPLRNGLYFPNSNMAISRISSCSSPVNYHAPSYGYATVSHGLGAQPDAGVVVSGDGGANTTDYLLGFDQMGSSSVELWITLSGGTGYARFSCVRHSG